MIRECKEKDFETIYAIINEAASAYKGVIPQDRWKEPYMPKQELKNEIEHGVRFWGYEENGELLGVMGIQDVKDVTLIRHAYIKRKKQKEGIGGKLLSRLMNMTRRPVLIGTWRDAKWAINFYIKHGFRLVSDKEKDLLLRKYWDIPERQIETSVVLADKRWFERKKI